MYGGWDVHGLHVFMGLRVACRSHDSFLSSRLVASISSALPCRDPMSVTVSQLHTLHAQLFCLATIAGYRVRQTMRVIGEADVVPGLSFKGLMRWFFLGHAGWVEHEQVAAMLDTASDTGVYSSMRMQWRGTTEMGKIFDMECLSPLSLQITNLNASLRVPRPVANGSSCMWALTIEMSRVSHSMVRKAFIRTGFVEEARMFGLCQFAVNLYGAVMKLPVNLSLSEASEYISNLFRNHVQSHQVCVYGIFPVFPALHSFFASWLVASAIQPSEEECCLDSFLSLGGGLVSMERQLRAVDLGVKAWDVVTALQCKQRRSRLFNNITPFDDCSSEKLFTMFITEATGHPGFLERKFSALGSLELLNSNIPAGVLPSRPLLYVGFVDLGSKSGAAKEGVEAGVEDEGSRVGNIAKENTEWLGAWSKVESGEEERKPGDVYARMYAGPSKSVGSDGLLNLFLKDRLPGAGRSFSLLPMDSHQGSRIGMEQLLNSDAVEPPPLVVAAKPVIAVEPPAEPVLVVAEPVSAGARAVFNVLGIEKVLFGSNGKSTKERSEYLEAAFANEKAMDDGDNVDGVKAFSQSFVFKKVLYDAVRARRAARRNMIQFDDYPPLSTEAERKSVAESRITAVCAAETLRVLNEDVSTFLRRNIALRAVGCSRKYDEMEEHCTKMLALVKKARTLEKDV